MRSIAELKLRSLSDRLRASHHIETNFAPELLDELVRRCTESEVGARNVEHALRGSLMPMVSRSLLERMAGGDMPRRLDVGVAPDGAWRIEFSDAAV